MALSNKTILIISPEPWDHIFVSKHHYAVTLSKRGNKVYFLSPPPGDYKVEKTAFENLFTLDYPGFPPGLRFYPRFIQQWVMRRVLKKSEKLCQVHFDIIWSFDNSVFYDFDAFKDDIYKISHIVDLNQDFQTARAAETADLCLCTTEAIKNRMGIYNKHVFNLGHGYNLSNSTSDQPIQLPGKNKIKCFYAGSLDIPYLDWELINELVSKHPEIDFVFAGNWKNPQHKGLLSKHNFFHVGILQPDVLLRHYKASDVLLICYLYSQYPDQLSNPHKMMEYLGSGKMIVATWTSEYAHLHKEALISMAKSYEEYLKNFEKVLSELDLWNDKNKQNKRINFANKNSYPEKVKQIENSIGAI